MVVNRLVHTLPFCTPQQCVAPNLSRHQRNPSLFWNEHGMNMPRKFIAVMLHARKMDSMQYCQKRKHCETTHHQGCCHPNLQSLLPIPARTTDHQPHTHRAQRLRNLQSGCIWKVFESRFHSLPTGPKQTSESFTVRVDHVRRRPPGKLCTNKTRKQIRTMTQKKGGFKDPAGRTPQSLRDPTLQGSSSIGVWTGLYIHTVVDSLMVTESTYQEKSVIVRARRMDSTSMKHTYALSTLFLIKTSDRTTSPSATGGRD